MGWRPASAARKGAILPSLAVLSVLVLLATAFGCSGAATSTSPTPTTPPGSSGTSSTVSGTAGFSSSTPLPADAELVVSIVDNSNPDAATATTGETTITAGGKASPIPFEVPYDLSTIDPTHLYALRATITSGGKTLFETKGNTMVISQGRPTTGIAIVLKEP